MTPRAQTRKQNEEFTMFGYYDNLPRQRPDHVVKDLTSLRVCKQNPNYTICLFFLLKGF